MTLYEDLEFLTTNWRSRRAHTSRAVIVDYIRSRFEAANARITQQIFPVPLDGTNSVNVIGSYGPEDAPRIIVGAHYDVCDNPGADDNGSGVVGLLELARRLDGISLTKRIDLVAFANEEPPYFCTEHMGSVHHARLLKQENVKVEGMICLEMIGCFYDEPGTQDIPDELPFLKPFITKGNFVAICGRLDDSKIIRPLTRKLNSVKKKLAFPIMLPQRLGSWIEMSDHMNYWKEKIPAVMITDTAFYRHAPDREPTYHSSEDTIHKINFQYMEKVIIGVFNYLKEAGNK